MAKRILVVDDEVDTLKLLGLRLKKNGYQVSLCENGKCALRKIQNQEFDLAILDIKLPDMNGYDLLKKMRTHPQLKKIPVIFSTADASIAVKKTVAEYDANDFVIKPYDASQLLEKISSLLN